ncbi:MAG: transposase [Nanoarchaeota archaeon]
MTQKHKQVRLKSRGSRSYRTNHTSMLLALSKNKDGFLDYIKILYRKYPKMIFFMDKATYHKKEARVKKFISKHKHCMKIRWFPSGFPEANPMEEC